jgi:uncharacterized repeat protein (TIGR03943 family)
MRRETGNVLLLLVGGALLRITLNGSYLRYVKPSAQLVVLAAAVVIMVLAVVSIVRDVVSGRVGVLADGHHHHGGRAAWLLLLPVLAILVIEPPALGADSVLRAGTRAPAVIQRTAFQPLPAGAVVPIALSEFITRSVWDSSGSLDDRTVSLTGFVVHEGGDTFLARLVITCCAADATPMKVELAGGGDFTRDDQWIVVAGRLRPGSATQANGYTPTIDVTSLTTTAQPTDPYEY